MLIKVKRNWKELVDSGPQHAPSLSRREFMMRGLATGAMSVALHEAVVGQLIAKAYGDTLACPAPVKNIGSVAQIFASGGPTMGARFISDNQASAMSTSIAKNYGIGDANGNTTLMKIGPNLNVDVNSPFGATLLAGPPGYAGGAAGWQANVLSKVSGGGHLGQFNQDDGAGENTGLVGGVSPFKLSTMGKDLRIGTSVTPAMWANGLPSTTVNNGNLSPNTLASTFSLIPAAGNFTNSDALKAASDAANALGNVMDPVFSNPTRKLASTVKTNAGCAFYGNSALADSRYGINLFTPTGITALTSKLTVGSLTNAEQAQLAAFYQSAAGVAGGVVIQFDGRDYHGGNVQNDITPKDVEEARAIVMFLAACDAAQAPGAMIYLANGQAIANATQQATVNLNGTNVTVNGPAASGDAGGAYNAGLIIFYSPTTTGGAPSKFTGTIDSDTGNANTDTNIPSSKEAVAGLYLSAIKWVGGDLAKAEAKVSAAGISAQPSRIMVI